MRTSSLCCALLGASILLCSHSAFAEGPESAAQNPAPTTSKPLVVGTLPVPPFVIHNADGSWGGISIDLWKRVADKLGLHYEIQQFPLDALLKPDPQIDVVVSLNITAERELVFDLTHAFYSTGLAIAVSPEPQSTFDMLKSLVMQREVWLSIGAILGALLFVALLIWAIERRNNPDEFGGVKGLVNGLFWSVEAMLGYHDASHQSRAGRVLGMLWVLFSVVVISGFTAKLSSALTVEDLRYAIGGPQDLPRVKVGTVNPSAGSRYLSKREIAFTGYPNAEAAMDGLAKGEVQALVYEAPILQYLVTTKYPGKVKVLDGTFENHGYGFGLRLNSPLRKPVNQTLLSIANSEEFRQTMDKYLGGN
jgi:ABC-type amino acid transport substrate-binding protein